VIRPARFVAVLVFALIGFAVEARAVEPKFPLGRETTFVEGPLDKDGYIDYAAALNEHYGRGVTPENNAHVLLWKALGPGPVDQAIRAEYFQRLGVEVPPEKGNYFVTFRSFVESRESDPDRDSDRSGVEAAEERLKSAVGRPWTADEFPGVAAWLSANEAPLALLVDALKRPRYFRPTVVPSTPEGRGNLLEAAVPGIAEFQDLARALAARALLRTGEGKFAEAWDDLLRCRRLGRLVAHGPTLIDFLMGCTIDAVAATADTRYLERRKWTIESAGAHIRDLDGLPTMPLLADKFDLGERFQFLDAVRLIRRGGPDAIQRLGGAPPQDNPSVFRKLMDSIDYSPALRNGNRWFDRLVRAARMKERAARNAEFRRIDIDLKTLIPSGTLGRFGFWFGLSAGTATTRGERIGDLMTVLLLPAMWSVADHEDRAVQRGHNIKIAIGLAAFRDETGHYPTRLDELVPKYLADVPIDLFSEKPPVYRAAEKGYVLYSVGRNGNDDDGRNYYDNPETDSDGDDISIRMPIPQPTSVKER
jgi:hypothetical protein